MKRNEEESKTMPEFPGPVERGKSNRVILNDEQLEWLTRNYPHYCNVDLAAAMGISKQCVVNLAYNRNLHKSVEHINSMCSIAATRSHDSRAQRAKSASDHMVLKEAQEEAAESFAPPGSVRAKFRDLSPAERALFIMRDHGDIQPRQLDSGRIIYHSK